jgi:hypothetical protein
MSKSPDLTAIASALYDELPGCIQDQITKHSMALATAYNRLRDTEGLTLQFTATVRPNKDGHDELNLKINAVADRMRGTSRRSLGVLGV